MSTLTQAAVANLSMFYVAGALMRLSTANLLDAYATGENVHLYSIAEDGWINGHIQGVRNESGSAAGRTPNLLLVTLSTTDGRCIHDLFVRTHNG